MSDATAQNLALEVVINTNRTAILSCISFVIVCLITNPASFALYTNHRTIATSGTIELLGQSEPFRAQRLNCLYSSVYFTDSEISYIASNYDVIVIQGYDYQGLWDSTLKLKQERPDIIILVYISAPSASPKISTYINWTEVNSHEDWFLHDVDGNRLQIIWESGWYCMDVANPEWRKYLGDYCYETLTQNPQIDGIFCDNAGSTFWADGWTVPREKLPWDSTFYYEVWHEDMKGLLAYLKSRIGSKLLIPNTSDNADFVDVSDGMMAEGFVHYSWWDVNTFGPFGFPNALATYPEEIARFKSVLDRGKYFLAIDGSLNIQSVEDAERVFYYSFCSFLLIANEKASFEFTTWNYLGNDDFGLLELTKNAELLGQPTGDYYSLTNCLARNFENGRVIVNYSSYSATVDLGGNFKTLEGNVLSQITLPDHTGVVLYKI